MTHYVLLLVESTVSENTWIGYHFIAIQEFEHIVPVLPPFKNGRDSSFDEIYDSLKKSEFNKVEKWGKENFIGYTVEEFMLARGGALTCFYFNQQGEFTRVHKLSLDITKVV